MPSPAPLRFDIPGAEAPADMAIETLLIAGWTGRDPAKVRHHIEELAAIGVPRPSTTPLYYRAPSALLTQAAAIQVLSAETGGEIEPVVIVRDGVRFLTVGSDHTDRGLEATSVAHSKAVCAKPIAKTAWPLEAIAAGLDALRLVSEISEDGRVWTRYQDGALSDIRPIAELIDGAPAAGGDAALFCGTTPAIGGVRPTPWFRGSLIDAARGRRIDLAYRAEPLAVVR